MVTNAEAWYNLTQSDIDSLEAVDESLLRKVLETPISTPVLDCRRNVLDVGGMSRSGFRNLIRKKTTCRALQFLNEVKGIHSKVLHIPHSELKMQPYLETSQLSVHESKFFSPLISMMLD